MSIYYDLRTKNRITFCRPITPEDEDGASTSSLVTVGAMSSMLVKTNERVNRDNNILSDDTNGVSDGVALTPTPIAAITPNLNSPLSELAPSTPSTTAMASPILITTVGILDLVNKPQLVMYEKMIYTHIIHARYYIK